MTRHAWALLTALTLTLATCIALNQQANTCHDRAGTWTTAGCIEQDEVRRK